ncbi:MAG: hypothetical protein K2M09_07440, partial [Muribaculaceae bacterium]|nr:hypothetical protein [Muribaculaceae bacterium]
TVRRYVRKYESPVNVYPRNQVQRQIRIPAIATVGAGEHEGRLITAYDFRWCKATLAAATLTLPSLQATTMAQPGPLPDLPSTLKATP